jgi:tetratricopeptide (TPR) repeat protein
LQVSRGLTIDLGQIGFTALWLIYGMGRHFALALLICFALPSLAWGAAAVGVDAVSDSLSRIEDRWVDIRYVMTDTDTRVSAARALRDQSRAALADNPGRAEVKFWHGMVLLLEAEYKRELGSLHLVREAKRLFEEVEAENPHLYDGRVETALGMLYSDVPGWPVAFGDDAKATTHFLKALTIDPDSQEANYLYGDFLRSRKKLAEALPYLETALRAPLRPGHERADQFRRREVEQDLKAVRAEVRPERRAAR